MLEKMTPQEKQQMAMMQRGMLDLQHLTTKLKPAAENPDAPVSTVTVLKAMAGAPCMKDALGEERVPEGIRSKVTDEVLTTLETALIDAGAFAAGELASCEGDERRNVLLIYWHMHKQNLPDLEATLPQEVDQLRAGANQVVTTLLIKAQMLMPQNRWVQPTLAIARASALISTALWSHTDERSLALMKTILAEDELPMPKLSLKASAAPKNGGEEILAGQQVCVRVVLTREHAAVAGDGGPRPAPNNPQGIFEAYWLYVEGLKPEGTPNSLIVAKPMTVKDLETTEVADDAVFTAPPAAGSYTLRVHLTSTSVVGVELTADVSFTVAEDDVPALE